MVILPNDSGIAPGVCGVGGAHQQPLQFNKRRKIHARRALGHRGATTGSSIQSAMVTTTPAHDVQKSPRRSLRYAPDDGLAAKIGMPAVLNFQLLPDMGRMNG
jgi:hypothetical protein